MKLKQGNGRGTCCWIIYNLIIHYLSKFRNSNLQNKYILQINFEIFYRILRSVALSGCLRVKRKIE